MLWLVAALTLLSLLLFWRSRRGYQAAGIPAGRVIYADTGQWGPVPEPLYDPAMALTGKPDYLVRRGNQIIPVEIKSGRSRAGPYDSHIFQLAAYCLLIQRTLGVRPPYGILHYPDRTYAIDYTSGLEAELLELLAEIRRQEGRQEVDRSHDSLARCRACGFRSQCDQRLPEHPD